MVYFQNFQQGDGGYTADNTGGSVPGMWHYSTGRNADNLPDHSLPDSWYYGGGESATGGGNYSTWVASQGVLTSPPISLPASGTSIASFSYVLGTRNILDGDFAYVSVLPKNGSPITILSRTAGTLPQTNGDWQSAVADLSRFDGQTIQLQFTFNMVYANPPDPEGWYVDDVAIVNSVVPPPATISGRKFEDLNGSGTDLSSDPGLAGWTIYVDYNNDGTLDPGDPSAVTTADGSYTIANIKSGTWTVREVPQSGWTNSFPAGGFYTETFVSGSVQTGLDFGNWTPASVQQSRKFYDLNDSGTDSSSDPGLAGWTIYVDYNNDSTLDPGDPHATTAADGSYTITGIKPGTWTVREVPQNGWTNTYPAGGSYTETFQSGGTQTGLDFGNWTPDIAGYVWDDSNDPNGQWDGNAPENEPGLNGWTVYVDLKQDGRLDPGDPWTVTTSHDGNDGYYAFSGLAAGTYTVRELIPRGSEQTYPGPSANLEWSVSVDPAQGVVAAGQFGMTESPNFGDAPTQTVQFITPVSVSWAQRAFCVAARLSTDTRWPAGRFRRRCFRLRVVRPERQWAVGRQREWARRCRGPTP